MTFGIWESMLDFFGIEYENKERINPFVKHIDKQEFRRIKTI